MHVHTGLPHEVPSGIPSLCRPEPCEGDGQATVNSTELMKKTLEAMDRNNIIKAFLSGVDWSIVQQWAKAAPERFIPSPFIIKPDSSALKNLRQEYISGRFRGMGEIGTQLNRNTPNVTHLWNPIFKWLKNQQTRCLYTFGPRPLHPHFAHLPVTLYCWKLLVNHTKFRLFDRAEFEFTYIKSKWGLR